MSPPTAVRTTALFLRLPPVVPSTHIAAARPAERPPAPHTSIRLAVDADRAVIHQLLAEMAPELDPTARLAWLYDGNPQGGATTWLAMDGATAAGMTSYIPFDLSISGERVRGALGSDGYVRPAFRRRGIASALHDAARAAMPRLGVEVMFGAPTAANIAPLEAGGSRVISDVVRYLRPLRGSALGVAGIGGRIAARVLAPRAGADRLDPVVADDARVDAVWAATRDELGIATVRDARFYTWRFVHAPAQRQLPFVIVDGDRPIAVCALERLTNRDRTSRIRIVDLVAPARDWGRALAAIERHADDCDAVDVKLLRDDASRRSLWRHGFIAREAKPFLCVVRDGSPRAPLLHDRARWYYTGADSDIDTLE